MTPLSCFCKELFACTLHRGQPHFHCTLTALLFCQGQKPPRLGCLCLFDRGWGSLISSPTQAILLNQPDSCNLWEELQRAGPVWSLAANAQQPRNLKGSLGNALEKSA